MEQMGWSSQGIKVHNDRKVRWLFHGNETLGSCQVFVLCFCSVSWLFMQFLSICSNGYHGAALL